MARLPKHPYWRQVELEIRETAYWLQIEAKFQAHKNASRGLCGKPFILTKYGYYEGGGVDAYRAKYERKGIDL